MAIPANKETYLDRLLTDEQAVGLPHILNLDPDVNVKREDYRSLSDAYNYYLGGGLDASATDTAQIPGAVDTLVASGGDGGETGITAAGVTPTSLNTQEQQRLLNEGIGTQLAPGQPVVAPGEMPVTQAEMDAFNQPIVQDPMTGDASIAEKIAAQNRMEASAPIMDQASDEYMTEMVKTPLVQEALGKVKDGISTTGEFISRFGMPIWNAAQGAYGASLAGLVGLPGMALGLVGDVLKPSQSQLEYESYSPEAKQAVDQAYGSAGIMAGYNPVSALGEGVEATIQDRIDTIDETLETKDSEILEDRKKELENLLSIVQGDKEGQITTRDAAIDTGIAAADDDSGADMLDIATGIDDFEVSGDIAPGGMDQVLGPVVTTPTTTFTPRGGGADRDPAPSAPAATVSRSDSDYGQFGRRQEATASGGGGGNSSGGKSIVCTAMYQTTGLEDWSKAMKIWYIYQQKYLTEEHQKGYHKLFKPFVKAMYKNKFIKAIGAHVAKHRTQDLKSIMFGSKSSLLGRIYRKILEPICYWVGKNG